MKKICIAEDDSGIARLITRKLEKKGYEVTQTSTGEETIKNLSADNKCLLLLDFILPDYTADELITVLEERGLKIPFIVMTGQGDERVAVEMMKRGARDYVIKDSHFLEVLPEVVGRVFSELEREHRLKKTEHALELSQFKYRMMAENIRDGVIILENRVITYVNPRLIEITGFSSKELKAMQTEDLAVGFETERLGKYFADFRKNDKRKGEIGYWIKRKDDCLRHVDTKFSIVTIGRKRYSFITMSDDTEKQFALKATKESEAKYRMLFESSPLAIITINDDGSILSFNPTTERMLGYTRDRMLGRHAGTMLPEVIGKQGTKAELSCDHSHGSQLHMETIAVRADKTKIPVELSCAKWKIKSDEVTAIILIDITNRKLQENHLITAYKIKKIIFEEEDTKKALQGVIGIMGKAIDVDRVYVFKNSFVDEKLFMNQRFEWVRGPELTEINNPELQNLSYSEMGFERWEQQFDKKKLIKGIVSKFPEGERKILEPQGILSVIVLPIIVGSKIWGFVGFDDCRHERVWTGHEESMLVTLASNISTRLERDITRDKVEKSRRLLQTTIESIEEAVLVLNIDMTVQLVNSKFISMFKDDDTETVDPIEMMTTMIESGDVFVDLMSEVAITNKDFNESCRLVTGKYLECFSCPLEPGNPDSGRLWTFRDITSKMRQERAKREFINSVAHELRNPLVLIQGYTELLLEKLGKNTEERSMLDIIYDATKREIRQVSDFVDVGRTNPIYNFRVVETYGQFENIIEKLAVYIKKQVQHIHGSVPYEYIHSVSTNLKTIKINIDSDRVQEIIENLIINSIKYSKRKNIKISFKAWTEGNSVCFSVEDCGVGIPEEDISKVFKPFYQVDRGSELSIGGLGLGLANVMLHINSHDGEINLKSEDGKGTIVTVKLPVLTYQSSQITS